MAGGAGDEADDEADDAGEDGKGGGRDESLVAEGGGHVFSWRGNVGLGGVDGSMFSRLDSFPGICAEG